MLGDTAARRRARRVLGPWLIAGVGVWLASDNAPALIEEWRLGGAGATGTATVLSMEGGRPSRAIRRRWDDLFWGRGRRVTYQFAPRDGRSTSGVAFVSHGAADALRQGGPVQIRFLAADPSVDRIEGEPGVVLLSFRLFVGLALALLCIFLLWGKRQW